MRDRESCQKRERREIETIEIKEEIYGNKKIYIYFLFYFKKCCSHFNLKYIITLIK